ncbi:hypothetical protein BKA70DRAFT_1213995 [Coprinopsis sp. MPI-PUGE-AT-0042]|nr:hypothetical protein BKA70DRAFT_1213995 [Coprinopsis sp. MPI-PUGE-AT-0042]
MSTISPQDRTRAGKREYIQRGRQWIKTRLDRFRGGSASACSTRPSNAQAAGVPPSGAIPSLGNAACGLDAPVPPNDLLVSSDSLRMATCTASIHSLAYADAGISPSNSNQAPVATPFVTSERGVGIEHTTSSRQPSYNRAQDEPTETPLPCSRPLPEPRRTFGQECLSSG